jgi:hypothetical protein
MEKKKYVVVEIRTTNSLKGVMPYVTMERKARFSSKGCSKILFGHVVFRQEPYLKARPLSTGG